MMKELTFDVNIEDFLFQKFLLQICKICDDIYFFEGKMIKIPFEEKERMAEEMLTFIAHALNSLEKGSLVKLKKKPKDFRKKFKELTKAVEKKAGKDRFTRFVLLDHIMQRKIRVKKISDNLTLSIIALLTKDTPMNFEEIERRVKKIEPFFLRVAALICPFVELYDDLKKKIEEEGIEIKVLKEKVEKETLSYIG